jgi:hypothetical protein
MARLLSVHYSRSVRDSTFFIHASAIQEIRLMALKSTLFGMLAVGLMCSPASAGTFTFATAAGATEPMNSLPVNASTTITTGAGTVSVTLTNLLADPSNVPQVLTDLLFILSGGNTLATTIASSAGQEITIAGNGTSTLGAVVATGWKLDSSSPSGTIHLCEIGPGTCGGGLAPSHGIIGPPDSGGIYSNAKGSIAGNSAHNPFLSQTATWSLLVPGVTADTVVSGVMFSFNTSAGDDVPGSLTFTDTRSLPPTVPEPATLALFGTGLTVVAAKLRRRRAS